MKALLDWEPFRDALHLISSISPGKPNLGEPSLVQIIAEDSSVSLVSIDYDCMIRFVIQDGITVDEPGSTTLPCLPLYSFVRDLTTNHIQLANRNEDICVISADGDSLELVAIPDMERETLPEVSEKNSFELESGLFASLVEKCAFAVAKDDRRGLNGIRLEVSSDKIRLVATDTRRLALVEAPLSDAPDHLEPVVLPTKIVSQLISVIRRNNCKLKITILSSQVAFETEGLTLFTRTLQAKFPEQYAAIIPTKTSNSCYFSPEEMARKLRLVSNMSADELRSVEFQLDSSTITLVAVSPGQGTAKAEVNVRFKGIIDRLKYNPDYLIEALKKSDSEEVELCFEKENTPGKFILGEGFTYVVMPINV